MGCGASTNPSSEEAHKQKEAPPSEKPQHDLASLEEADGVERQFAESLSPPNNAAPSTTGKQAASNNAASTIQAAERGKQARLRVKRKKTSLAITHTVVEPDYIGSSGAGGVDTLLVYNNLKQVANNGNVSLDGFQKALQRQGMEPNHAFTEALYRCRNPLMAAAACLFDHCCVPLVRGVLAGISTQTRMARFR